MLLEGKFTFDVIDLESELSPYRLVILPDAIPVGPALKAKLEAYLAAGGRVLLTGRSGIGEDGRFVLDAGAEWQGTSPNKGGDFVLPIPALRSDFVADPLFMYAPAERITLTDGETLGDVYEPYFDRTPRHFSGHVNAASQPDPSGWACGSRKGGITYFAFPIFTCYHQLGAVAMLEIAEKLIASALGGPQMLTASLPRAGRATVRHQAAANRDVVHLLHAAPVLRGQFRGAGVQPIQDLVPLQRRGGHPRGARGGEVRQARSAGRGPSLLEESGRIAFEVPEVIGHQMIEVQY